MNRVGRSNSHAVGKTAPKRSVGATGPGRHPAGRIRRAASLTAGDVAV